MTSTTMVDAPKTTLTMSIPLLGAVMNGTASGEEVFRVQQNPDAMAYLAESNLGDAVYRACNHRILDALTGKAVQYRRLLLALGRITETPEHQDVISA